MSVINLERIDLTEDLANNRLDFVGQSSGVTSLSITDGGPVEIRNAIARNSNVVNAGDTITIDADEGWTVSGPLQVDGTITVDGSLTDTIGAIQGTGTIDGTGFVKADGAGVSAEPIDALISGDTYIMRSGWRTDLDTTTYNAYRFEQNSSLSVQKDEALTLSNN